MSITDFKQAAIQVVEANPWRTIAFLLLALLVSFFISGFTVGQKFTQFGGDIKTNTNRITKLERTNEEQTRMVYSLTGQTSLILKGLDRIEAKLDEKADK